MTKNKTIRRKAMKFCQQLSEYLCRLSCTGKELCALAGISAASFSRYKNGERVPELGTPAFEGLCRALGEIAEQTERYLKFEDYRDGKALEGKLNVSAAVGSAAVSMVEHIKAACIVTPTMSGQTARLISNLRPSVPIYGVTPYEWARRKMQLYWGVRPVTGYEEDSTENIISHAMYMVRREELVERGDMVIFTAGDPATNEVTGEGYMTNMLHIIQAK